MTPTRWHWVRLWWHCLWRFHRWVSWRTVEGRATRIACGDCGFGHEDFTVGEAP